MPVVKPSKVIGTDPSFHEFRLYMTPMMYRGRKILAFHASCKHSQCNFSSAWASDASRAVGMFKHRSEKVTEARRDHYAKEFGGNILQMEAALLSVSDKNSHTFENWVENVASIYRGYIGEDFEIETKDENRQLQVDYYIGLTAQEVARKIFNENYEN